MPREIINLDADIAPLQNWFTQSTTTILIVAGNGTGATEAKTQIKRMLDGNEDEYANVAFGFVSVSGTLQNTFQINGITGFEDFALLSISPNPKKLISKIKDEDLRGNPGYIQQAIIEAEGA